MAKLYTYKMVRDSGFAPNPFGGICTQAGCFAKMRKQVDVGDWMAGFVGKGLCGAPNEMEGNLIYAMQVEEILSHDGYIERCANLWRWKERKDDAGMLDAVLSVGDCLHKGEYADTKCGPGDYVLISRKFYYFGRAAIRPFADPYADSSGASGIDAICPNGVGFQSHANNPYLNEFVGWLSNLGLGYGIRGLPFQFPPNSKSGGCA